MKMKLTALLLTSLICMAASASCGKVDTAIDNTAKLEIATTTAASDASGETETTTAATTTGGETTTSAADETTTGVVASADAAATNAAQTEAPAANNNENNNATEAPAQQQEQPQQNADAPAETPNNEPTAQEVKFSTEDLLKNAADTISALGGSPVTSVSPSCTNKGGDVKTYDYSGELKIQCYIDGGAEYIFDYDILGGNYSTSKGIKVGSSRADVEAAYGAGEVSGNTIIYMEGEKQLIFTLSGDTVSEIDFYVPV